MKIVILTQSDPFYLAANIRYLLNNLPSHTKVTATILFKVSPFGRRESFLNKAKRTVKIFGLRFFVFYGVKFILYKLVPGNSVKSVLNKQGVPIINLEKDINHPASLNVLKKYEPDLLISIAGNQIFKQELIDLAPNGCLNLHTALLPKYRGLMPSFWVLKNNEKETGVSVFFVDKGIDSGPILVQKHLPIDEGMTQAELIRKSKRLGMNAILEAIQLIHLGNYTLIGNSDEDSTYFTFPTREDVLDFYNLRKRFY
jgi:methionyl-tRNA formyltransferase